MPRSRPGASEAGFPDPLANPFQAEEHYPMSVLSRPERRALDAKFAHP